MKRFIATLSCLTLLGIAVFSSGRAQQPENVRTLMRMKLAHSHSILEGIALEDFDRIAKSSSELAATSQAAAWQVFQTPEYSRQSAAFRRTCDDLSRNAKAKNLDAAALDYVKLTMQCVECHKYVRGVRLSTNTSNPVHRLADAR